MQVQQTIEDDANKEIASTLSTFCIKASELSQLKDDDEEEDQDTPTLTYEDVKSLLNKMGSSGVEMHKLRKSILEHLDQLFEEGHINFNLVNHILHHGYSKLAYHDSIITEMVARIIINFHKRIEIYKAAAAEAVKAKDQAKAKENNEKFEENKKEIMIILQVTRHYFIKVDVSIDVTPRIANLIFERSTITDFQPAIGMYGELLRAFQ